MILKYDLDSGMKLRFIFLALYRYLNQLIPDGNDTPYTDRQIKLIPKLLNCVVRLIY